MPQTGLNSNGLPTLNQTLFVNTNKLQITPTKRRVCVGDTTILQAYGASTETFTWTGPPGLDSVTKASPRFVATTPGTYTWSVVGTSTCTTATASVTITVLPSVPPLTLGPDTALCPGELFFPGPEAQPGFTYRWNTGATTSRINASAAGKYWLTITNGSCAVTDTIVVTLRPQTRPVRPWVASGGLVACDGDSVLLAAPFTNYSQWLWNTGATTSSTWVKQTGWYKVRIGRTDSCLSVFSDSLFIQFLTRRPAPQIALVPGVPAPDTVKACSGDTVRLRAFVLTGAEPTYRWTGGVAGPVLPVTQSGRYRVSGDYGNVCPTDSSLPVTVLFFSKPNAPNLAGPDTVTICSGDTANILVGDLNQLGVRYRWSVPGAGNGPRLRITQPGRYSVQSYYDSACLSPQSRTITVLLRTRAQGLTITGNRFICPGQGATWYSASGTGVTIWNWAVNGGGTIAQHKNDSVLILWPGAPGVYNLGAYAGDANLCGEDSVGIIVRVNKNLEPGKPLGDTLVCLNTNVTYSVPPNDRYPGAVYSWEFGGGNQTSGGNGPDITASFFVATGGARIRYRVDLVADSVCSGASPWQDVYPEPTLPARPFTQDTALCQGQTLTVQYRYPVTHTVQFDSGGAAILNRTIIWTSLENVATWELAFPNAGSYAVSVRETSARGCVGPLISRTVTVNPKPATPQLPAYATCVGSLLTIGNTANPSIRYRWTPSDYISNDTLANPVFLFNQLRTRDTAITYIQTVTDRVTGCSNDHTVTVLVKGLPPRLAIDDTTLCEGEQIELGPSVLPGIYTLIWSPSRHLSDTLTFNPTFTAPQVSRDTAFTYTVRILDGRGCQRIDTVTISVNPRPDLAFTGDTTVCANAGINLETVTGRGYQWYERRNGTWVLLAVSPSLNEVARNAGSTDTVITYKLEAGLICPAQREIRVTVHPEPRPQLVYANLLVCPGTGPVAYKVRGLPNSIFTWQVEGGAFTTQPSPSDTTAAVDWRQDAASYRLTVTETSVNGCGPKTQSITLTAPANPALEGCDPSLFPLSIPNVITPNGDGFNVRWIIENLQFYGNVSVTLTNRWG